MVRDARHPISFAPLNKKSVATAERLLVQIRGGAIRPGQKLPSERELARSYNVSRTVVREALSALQLAGVVEARVGDGNYVRAGHRFDASRDVLARVARSVEAGVSLIEMLMLREALDVAIAHLAIANATPADLGEIRRVLRLMRLEVQRGGFRAYLALTLKFHAALARAAHSELLASLETALLQKTRAHLWLLVRNYTRAKALHSLRTHTLIFRGIASRQLPLAVEGITRHYRDYPSLAPDSTIAGGLAPRVTGRAT